MKLSMEKHVCSQQAKGSEAKGLHRQFGLQQNFVPKETKQSVLPNELTNPSRALILPLKYSK